MNDPPGVSSMLGIETVEWIAEGGENLTVRVTGRWRRRRPAWSAQPILVVEAAGRRFRFPAMPEPPSVTGIGPGMWRISFAVPAALAPELGGRTWLQLGAVVVPLPAAVEPPGQQEPEPTPEPAAGETSGAEEVDQAAVGASPQSSELAAEDARRRAREAEEATLELTARVESLERQLAAAQLEAQQLSGQLSERELSRRAAEQRAHAAQAQRRDLARQLAARGRDAERARETLGELAAAEERVRGLEGALETARRRVDEAEQVAAAATAARQRAEQASGAVSRPPAEAASEEVTGAGVAAPSPGQRERLSLEHRLLARRASTASRVPSEPPAVPARAAAVPARAPTAAAAGGGVGDELVAALRRELETRAASEAALRVRLLDAEGSLAARGLIERRTADTLARLRQEFDGLRAAFEREREARKAAEQRAAELSSQASGSAERSRAAHDAIAELRRALEQLRTATPLASGEPQPESARDVVEPERLNDARQRLRDAIAPQPLGAAEGIPAGAPAAVRIPEAERTSRAWLEPIWDRLAHTDPGLAGRLLVELLPAQREAYSERVAYDLVFGSGRGCAQVTARDGAPVIRHADGPRPRNEVDFQVLGDPAAIARMLIAGPLRRRFGRGVARVRGRRDRLAALRSLVGVRLDLHGLHRIGVRFEPELALRLAALMIDPAWTGRESFAVGYRAGGSPTVYLLVRDGAPVQITTEAPASGIAATISGPADSVALAIAGERPREVTVTGEEWPLALLRKWIKRAQSD